MPFARSRCRSFVDHYILSQTPPELDRHSSQIPTPLRPYLRILNNLTTFLDNAFPPQNSIPPPNLTVQSFQFALGQLDSPLHFLLSPFEMPDPPGSDFIHMTAEAQIPPFLVSILSRVLYFLKLANQSHTTLLPPTWNSYLNLIRQPPVINLIRSFIVTLLRTMNALVACSDLLTARMAEHPDLLPALFSAIRVPNAVELALALIEEALHSPTIRREFDLVSIVDLPDLVLHLTPFQLGSFCRVLAPLVDERDPPLCGGDHCTGACSLPGHVPSNDWQQIEPTARQLKVQRSYVGAEGRALRDRNHAVLLAIPGLVERFVKLIAVPPAAREELVLVDHATRSGVFSLNFDFADAVPEGMGHMPLHTALVAVRAEEGGMQVHADLEVVMDMNVDGLHMNEAAFGNNGTEHGAGAEDVAAVQMPEGPPSEEGSAVAAQGVGHHVQGMLSLQDYSEGQDGNAQRQEEEDVGEGEQMSEVEIRRRVLYMVCRKLTGMDFDDAELAGTMNWKVLDDRIDRAEAEHAKQNWKGNSFRERRRRSSLGSFGVDIRFAPGDANGVVGFMAMPGMPGNNNNGANNLAEAGGANNVIETGAIDVVGVGVNSDREGDSNDVPPPLGDSTQRYRNPQSSNLGANGSGSAQRGDDQSGLEPELSINGLLMSSHQVEVLFVLFSLLIGRRKVDVQNRLIDANIFPILNRFCDGLVWTESGQETKTEESLKVHFIRLVHYMCDGLDADSLDNRLNLLFSDRERTLLKAIEAEGQACVGHLGGLYSRESFVSSSEPMDVLPRAVLQSPSPISGTFPFSNTDNCAGESGKASLESSFNRDSFVTQPIRNDNTTEMQEQGVFYKPKYNILRRTIRKEVGDVENAFKELGITETDQDSGIICKLTKALISNVSRLNDRDSTRRYLLSGCIETYLRGASVPQKTLIAREGLLLHLLRDLSESADMASLVSQLRQTSFDLLGQLVKWNRTLFALMNELFRREAKLLPNLLRALSDRLVDSNVFIRSIAISLERFRAEDHIAKSLGEMSASHALYDFENCLLWDFFETYRIRLLHDLIASVRVEDLNFENICCVNTTLILLVTTCQTEEALDVVLSEVFDDVIASINSNKQSHSLFAVKPVDLFDNFTRLIDFWLSYYEHQGIDVASQEVSSNIHFDRLVTMSVQLKARVPKLSILVRGAARRLSLK